MCTLLGILGALGVMLALVERLSVERIEGELSAFTRTIAGEVVSGDLETVGRVIAASPYRLTIVLPDGKVQLDTRVSAGSLENHAGRKEVQEALSKGEGGSERYSTTLAERTVYHAIRLEDGRVLRLAVTTLTPWGETGKLILYLGAIILFGALISRAIAVVLARRIVAPLNRIDVEHPEQIQVYSELNPLVERMREQRERIRHQIQQIKDQNRTLGTIAKGMSEGLAVLDPEGKVLSVNESATRILGLTSHSVVGEPLRLPFDDWRFAELAAQPSVELNKDVHLGEKDYRFYLTRVSKRNRLIGYVLFILDMTLTRAAEMQRKEFTANVSHELKTPLQSIIGASELIENGLVRAEDVPSFASRIRKEGIRLVALVNDLILLSRLDEGAPEPGRQGLSTVRHIVEDIFERLADEARKKDISLILEGESTAQQCINGRYIYELIRNLCENAVKYHDGSGEVCVGVRTRDACLEITVRDDGPGICEADREHIFERFYRGQSSRQRRVEGTGLGLSIVKRVTLFFKGSITLTSEPGAGTVFVVKLPLENVLPKEETPESR